MDPSVLLRAYKSPQWPDPVEEYKGFLSLRQMMDLGKLRQVQLRQNEIENQQKLQDLEDDRRMREAFAGGIPDDATLSGLLQKFGKRGIEVYSAIRQAKTAESTRQTAELTRAAAERKAQQEHDQQVADVLYGVRNIQDPGQRQAAMDEATMMDLMRPEAQRLGLGRIGEVTPLAPNEQQFRARYAAAYTPAQLQTLLTNEAEAAQKGLTRPLELRKSEAEAKVAEANVTQEALETTKRQDEQAGRNLGLVYDQPSLTKWYKELPWEVRARIGPPPTFNPANLQRLTRMFMTAEQRVQADKRTDKLLTPAEFAQQLELARARSAAIQEGKPPTQGEELLAGYAARIKQANSGLDQIAMSGNEMGWNNMAPFEWMKTDAGKLFTQHEDNMINAILRRESGAVISDSERANARRQYIPLPWDPPKVLEEKRKNRLVVQQSFIRGAGKAYVDPDELLRQAGVDVPTLQPKPQQQPPVQQSPLLKPGEVVIDDPKLGKITLPNQAAADAYKKKYGIK